jgi:hypothetical protein
LLTLKTAAALVRESPLNRTHGLIEGPLSNKGKVNMGKKDKDKGPVECVAIDAFVLGPGERCEAGEILTLERKDFLSLAGMKRVRVADDADKKARKAVLAQRKKDSEPDSEPGKKGKDNK